MDYCNYHPEKEAVNKCRNCDRLICLADTQDVTQVRQSYGGSRTHGGVTSTRYNTTTNQVIYCIPCNVTRAEKAFEDLENAKNSLIFKIAKFFRLGLILLIIIRFGGSLIFFQSLSIPTDITQDSAQIDQIAFLVLAFATGLIVFFIIGALFIGFIAFLFGYGINQQLNNKDTEMAKAEQMLADFEKSLPA